MPHRRLTIARAAVPAAASRPVCGLVVALALGTVAGAQPPRAPEPRPPGWNPTDSIHARDTASMRAELRAAGRDTMSRAPYTHDFDVKPWMTAAWFATDSARRMAESILTYQAPNGGWSKHVDFTQGPRARARSYHAETNVWGWISTFDNASTTEEIRFLARANAARPDARYREAALRGLDYVLAAQMPNGCWPQNWPLEGSYHDAATFNDGVTTNVLTVLREAADGAYPFVPVARRREGRGDGARRRLRARRAGGGGRRRTVWGQQHDPLTLHPTTARSYELTSLSSLESAGVMDFLMSLPAPSARVVAAVHAAADWFRATALHDSVYQGYELRPARRRPAVGAPRRDRHEPPDLQQPRRRAAPRLRPAHRSAPRLRVVHRAPGGDARAVRAVVEDACALSEWHEPRIDTDSHRCLSL